MKAPISRFHLRKFCNPTEAGNIGIHPVRKEIPQAYTAALYGRKAIAPVEPNDIGQELNLLRHDVAVSAGNLPIDIPGVDKKHLMTASTAPVSFIEEPEHAGKRGRKEEMRRS